MRSPPPEFSLAFRDGGLAGVRDLTLSDYRLMPDDTLLTISEGCPELQTLTLDGSSRPTDGFFEPLCKFKKLETLRISNNCTERGELLKHVARMPALSSLSFTCTDLPGMEYLLDMPGLQYLSFHHISGYRIPFDSFPGRLVNLRELVFVRCFGDQRKVDEMCALMPDVKVEGTLMAWK
ncbi:uncharacterized protein LOC126428256 [Schistocerca serialis cubense]|uniref:uncharacterized protein LOC126428256 n=1 Tax=Schistocerca serialis cubense TaxID=2023355 RepID=UPI00214F28D6|nr:uncharacterized protein LOC126428256 [Schistocerca serialis cubense]